VEGLLSSLGANKERLEDVMILIIFTYEEMWLFILHMDCTIRKLWYWISAEYQLQIHFVGRNGGHLSPEIWKITISLLKRATPNPTILRCGYQF